MPIDIRNLPSKTPNFVPSSKEPSGLLKKGTDILKAVRKEADVNNIPLSKRGLGQRILLSTLAGLQKSGELRGSIRSAEQEFRAAERREKEQQEDREFQQKEKQKDRDARSKEIEDSRKYQEEKAVLAREIAQGDDRKEKAFNAVSDTLKQLPDGDPNRQKIIAEFEAKYPGYGSTLNNITLSEREQQKDAVAQQNANTAAFSAQTSAQNAVLSRDVMNNVTIPNAQTNALEAQTKAATALVPKAVTANQVNQSKALLEEDDTYKSLDNDKHKDAYAQATSELAAIVQGSQPGLSFTEATLYAAEALKNAVKKEDRFDLGMGFRDTVKFDAKQAAIIIGKMRPPVKGEVRVLSSGKQARYLGNGQWGPVQ